MLGGSSSMLLMQKTSHCKFKLGGDKYWGNFNKLNTFIKASTCSVCIGESNKSKAAKKWKPNSFGKEHGKSTTKLKTQNPNLKGVTCHFCGRKDMWRLNVKESYLLIMAW